MFFLSGPHMCAVSASGQRNVLGSVLRLLQDCLLSKAESYSVGFLDHNCFSTHAWQTGGSLYSGAVWAPWTGTQLTGLLRAALWGRTCRVQGWYQAWGQVLEAAAGVLPRELFWDLHGQVLACWSLGRCWEEVLVEESLL